MRDRDLYQQILGIPEPWRVTDVDLKLEDGKVEVFVTASPSAEMRCPECQAVSPRYDKRQRRWRHLDTCQYQTELVAEVHNGMDSSSPINRSASRRQNGSAIRRSPR